MELDSTKIQRLVNDVYKVGILDLLSYGPQTNAVIIEHILGGLTKGEFMFKDAMPFTPAMGELVCEGKVIAFSLAVGDEEVSFALAEDVDPELVHFMDIPDLAEVGNEITNTRFWRASLTQLDAGMNYTPVPRGDSPTSVKDIMSSIMAEGDADEDARIAGDDNG